MFNIPFGQQPHAYCTKSLWFRSKIFYSHMSPDLLWSIGKISIEYHVVVQLCGLGLLYNLMGFQKHWLVNLFNVANLVINRHRIPKQAGCIFEERLAISTENNIPSSNSSFYLDRSYLWKQSSRWTISLLACGFVAWSYAVVSTS